MSKFGRVFFLGAMVSRDPTAPNKTEGLKAAAHAFWYMIPGVASVTQASVGNYQQAFKEFAIDVLPPIALADLAVQVCKYVAKAQIKSFTETLWNQVADQVVRNLTDDDFMKSDMEGYYRLKHRQELLDYIKEVSPGLGKLTKFSSLAEPEIEARMSRHSEVEINNRAIHALQWLESFKVYGMYSGLKKMFNKQQLQARVYEYGMPSKAGATPVQRVAAKIMLDNLRIRTYIHEQVMSEFIDRVERLYNEKKGDFAADCEYTIWDKMKNSVLGNFLGRTSCDLDALKELALRKIQAIYNETADIIKGSGWGVERLDDGFSIHSQKIKDYSSDNKGEVEIVQDLQKIIDEFKEWAAMVTKGIDLFEEMRYLELQADAYGGVRNSFVPEQIHLLGNEFRVGISARVNKKRSHLKWSVYYYIRHEGKWEVLGQVQLNSNQFNPSNEGLWLIEAPEQATFYKVTKKDIKKYFSKDRQWSKIIPVMAFGD